MRYSGVGKTAQIACNHEPSTFCKARLLSEANLAKIFNSFYEQPKKAAQDAVIIKLLDVSKPKRLRVDENNRQRESKMIIKYYLPIFNDADESRIQVCRETFLSLFGE